MSKAIDAEAHHAAQLGRLLGALSAFQDDLYGTRYEVVGSARRVLSEHANTLDVPVDEEDGVSCDEAELRTIAEICPMATWHVDDRDDEQRLIAAADFARERLQGYADGDERRDGS